MTEVLFTDESCFDGALHILKHIPRSKDVFWYSDGGGALNTNATSHVAPSTNGLEPNLDTAIEIKHLRIPLIEIVGPIISRQWCSSVPRSSCSQRLECFESALSSLREDEISWEEISKEIRRFAAYFDQHLDKIERACLVIADRRGGVLSQMMLSVCKRVGVPTLVCEPFGETDAFSLEMRQTADRSLVLAERQYKADREFQPSLGEKKILEKLSSPGGRVSRPLVKDAEHPFVLVLIDDADLYSPCAERSIAPLIDAASYIFDTTSHHIYFKLAGSSSRDPSYKEALYSSLEKRLIAMFGARVRCIWCKDHSLENLPEFIVTVSSRSSIVLALMSGRKAITLGPTDFEFLGCTRQVSSVAEIPELISCPDELKIDRLQSLCATGWLYEKYLFPSGANGLRAVDAYISHLIDPRVPWLSNKVKARLSWRLAVTPRQPPHRSFTKKEKALVMRNRPEQLRLLPWMTFLRLTQETEIGRHVWRYVLSFIYDAIVGIDKCFNRRPRRHRSGN